MTSVINEIVVVRFGTRKTYQMSAYRLTLASIRVVLI